MNLELDGKTALVTGGSRGIGAATARVLAAEGVRLVLVARGGEALDRTAEAIAATGASVRTCVEDLADETAPERLAAAFPEVDILVNNAGGVPPGPLDALSVAAIRDGWAAKVFGYVGMIRAFRPLMASRGAGVVVNVIGMAGERVNAGMIALTGANAALIAMTRALGAESPGSGVRILGVNPSMTATERAKTLWRDEASRTLGDGDRWPELVAAQPFGRPADPDEIAAAIVFLASPRCGYVSGTVLNVDGGLGARP